MPTQAELRKRLHEVLSDPETWLGQHNEMFGAKKPREYLDGSEEERQVLADALDVMEYGTFS